MKRKKLLKQQSHPQQQRSKDWRTHNETFQVSLSMFHELLAFPMNQYSSQNSLESTLHVITMLQSLRENQHIPAYKSRVGTFACATSTTQKQQLPQKLISNRTFHFLDVTNHRGHATLLRFHEHLAFLEPCGRDS